MFRVRRRFVLLMLGANGVTYLLHLLPVPKRADAQGEKPAGANPQPAKPQTKKEESKPSKQAQKQAKGLENYPFTQAQLWGNDKTFVLWRVVGAAEGTVSVDGIETPNYFGHTDPGNGVWNRGAYSYQFSGNNPDPKAADKAQHDKIKRYHDAVVAKFAPELTVMEYLHALDLINQAPLCVAYEDDNGQVKENRGSYFDWLKKAKEKGLTGDEAIIYARVESFQNPSTGNYDTNFVSRYWLEKDQRRRMSMMNQAFDKWLSEQSGKTSPAVYITTVSFDASPFKQVVPLANMNARGGRLTETAIKAKLWYQGRIDKEANQPSISDDPVYMEGYNSTQ